MPTCPLAERGPANTVQRAPKAGSRCGSDGCGDEGHLMDLVQVSSINTSRGGSVARISGSRADARWQYSRKISMTWKEKKMSEFVVAGLALLSPNGAPPFWLF